MRDSVDFMAVCQFGTTVALVFAVAVAVASSSNPDHGTITPVRRMLIDTDAGGDDAVALIMAAEAERLENGPKVVGITCVNGNTDVNNVAENVLKTLKVVDRLDIPVFKGAAHPLLMETERDYYFGQDGFGDFYYPDPPSINLIQKQHAVNAMIEMVKASPGEITLVALGPLTNVALAIRMYPRFLDELQQLIIMGGSVEGRGNVRPNIEFNFFKDPGANFVVFNSSTTKQAILVPWETTERTQVTMEFRMSLSKFNNAKVQLIDSAEAISSASDQKYWNCADAVGMAVALTSGSIVTRSQTYYSDAIYEGTKTAGMIVVDYTNLTDNAANTNLIKDVNENVYKKLLLKYFSNMKCSVTRRGQFS